MEPNVQIVPPSNSQPNNDNEIAKAEPYSLPLDKRICLVGAVAEDDSVCKAAQVFGIPIITSETGSEYISDTSCVTYFILDSFDDPIFEHLHKSTSHRVLGTVALKQLVEEQEPLPNNTRPLFNIAMRGVVVCFTGFRKKEDLTRMIPLIHHMGGSIRKDMALKVTHLIAHSCGGDKYQYAFTFRLPILSADWVYNAWDQRNDASLRATQEAFQTKHKLLPFHGARVCFVGFSTEETEHMREVLTSNGGIPANADDPLCSHVVMDNGETYNVVTAQLSDTPAQTPKISYPEVSSTPTNLTPTNTYMSFSCVDSTMDLEDIQQDLTPISEEIFQIDSPLKRKRENFDLNNFESTPKTVLDDSTLTPSVIRTKKRRLTLTPRFVELIKTPITILTPKRRQSIASIKSNRELKGKNIFNVSPSESLENLSISKTLNSTSKLFDEDDKLPERNLFRKKSRKSLRKNKKNNDNDMWDISKQFFDSTEIDCLSDKIFETEKAEKQLKHHSMCIGEPDRRVLNESDVFLNPSIPLNNPNVLSEQPNGTDKSQKWRLHPHHLVVDESSVAERPEIAPKAHLVKAEWFWTSVQNAACADEKEYLFDDYLESILSPTRKDSRDGTPNSIAGGIAGGSAGRRKRKRLHKNLSSLVRGASISGAAAPDSPSLHKRRSSISDAGLLSVSGSFLDKTASPDKSLLDEPEGTLPEQANRKTLSPRQQVFIELVQTESNYVNILHTIMTMFKSHLEAMPEEEALLNNTELKIIFGNLPPIYETHSKMLEELRWASAHWSEDTSIGNIFLKYSADLIKAYPPFVNFFETMKEALVHCDTTKPRFHAFLKVCQTRPECGRQSLQELMIRPVQRLPSITLLLNDILKHTPKSNPDFSALETALTAIRDVITIINEDKRKTEGMVVMFNIHDQIDKCPADLVSSHRNFVTRCEVQELSDGLSGRGDTLVFFLFTDTLEVCKKPKPKKGGTSLKSPGITTNGLHPPSKSSSNTNKLPYKHVRLIPLSAIKKVIDIRESEDCHKMFAIMCRNNQELNRNNQELKEESYYFTILDEDVNKTNFLRTLCRQMANTVCKADAEKFLMVCDAQQMNIKTSEVASGGTLSKANFYKLAEKTRMKVGRAFSFNKTPLKRAVSSMMSPFGSSANLTPSSQLAQMRLASCSNINELGSNSGVANESLTTETLVAPLSVQPTRKAKCASLNIAALRRL